MVCMFFMNQTRSAPGLFVLWRRVDRANELHGRLKQSGFKFSYQAVSKSLCWIARLGFGSQRFCWTIGPDCFYSLFDCLIISRLQELFFVHHSSHFSAVSLSAYLSLQASH